MHTLKPMFSSNPISPSQRALSSAHASTAESPDGSFKLPSYRSNAFAFAFRWHESPTSAGSAMNERQEELARAMKLGVKP